MTIQTAGETSDDYHQDDDTPRGAEAVLRVLQVNENASFSVAQMVAALESRGWLPESEGGDPANAVRTALERVLNRNPGVKKLRKAGAVAYRYNEPEPEPGGESLDSILSGGPHPETIAEKAKADALLDIAAEGREIAEGGAD
jgi:hypothetical protein